MAGSFENWQNFCREVLGDKYRGTEPPQEAAGGADSPENHTKDKTPTDAPKAAHSGK